MFDALSIHLVNISQKRMSSADAY